MRSTTESLHDDDTKARTIEDLERDFNALIESAQNDDDGDGSYGDDSHASVASILNSILSTLKLHQERSNQSDDDGIPSSNKKDENDFIRTNLDNYASVSVDKRKSSSRNSLSPSPSLNSQITVSLRAILQSKASIAQLLHTLIEIMTASNPDQKNALSLKSLQACHVYLQTCLVSGSWSAGWIDMVAMRYVETILRKWKVFCCEYKMKIDEENTNAKSRLKRARLSQDEESDDGDSIMHEDNVYEMVQSGIELSRTLSSILLMAEKSMFWKWNVEAKDALFDAIVLAWSTCSALLPKIDEQKGLNKVCQDAVFEICRALEVTIVSSVEGEDSLSVPNHEDDGGQFVDNNGFYSPSSSVMCDDIVTSSTSRQTAVSVLRNLYPLLTFQVDLPNGVRGKQAAFDKCQYMIAHMVRSLSASLSPTAGNDALLPSKVSMTTPRTSETTVSTPLTGQMSIERKSVTPKTTTRKKLIKKRDSLNSLHVPPSLKKNVTPKRSSLPKSLLSSNTARRSAQRSKREEISSLRAKEILDIFVAIMQKLSTGPSMERVEVRTRVSSLITCVLENMKIIHRVAFVSFVIRLCSSKVSSHRIFGVELLCAILSMDWVWSADVCQLQEQTAENNGDGENAVDIIVSKSKKRRSSSFDSSEFPHNQSVSFLDEPLDAAKISRKNHLIKEILAALHGRVMDRAPAVRARVATSLSAALKDIRTTIDLDGSNNKCNIMVASMEQIGPDLITSLRQRAKSDEKATVRKAALSAFVDLLLLLDIDSDVETGDRLSLNVTQNDIQVLSHLCTDSSLVVRKTALDSLVQLLERQHCHVNHNFKFEIGSLEVAWVNFGLPLVRDTEPSCVSKVVDTFESLVVTPILDCADMEIDDRLAKRCKSAWKILSTVNHQSSTTGAKNAIKTIMRKLFEGLDSRDRTNVYVPLLEQINSIITNDDALSGENVSEEFVGAWCLLESIGSLHSNKKSECIINLKNVIQKSGMGTDFLVPTCDCLLTQCDEETNESRRTSLIVSARSCLNVVSSFAEIMEVGRIKALGLRLKEATKAFALVHDLIGPSTTALVSLAVAMCRGEPDATIASTCTEWIKEIFYKCEANLNLYVSTKTQETSISTLSRVVFTTGEMSLVGYQGNEESGKPNEKQQSPNPIKGLRVRPSDRLVRLIQSLLPLTLPSLDGVPGKEVDQHLRAHAFISFGKICLRDESLAKESLDIFAQELHQSGSKSNVAVRSNALLVLGDLCVCYTHLVDKFIPLMTTCLQAQRGYEGESNSSIVCQHAIILFSNLLLQDYIKWKGLLFCRFVAAAVSNDPVVANLARGLLCGPLLTKQPQLFSNNFIDLVFVLNGCKSHPMHSTNTLGLGNEIRSLAAGMLAVKDFDERVKIYNLLLDHMADEEKLGVTARLAKDVLQSATQRSGSLSLAASTHVGIQSEQNVILNGAYSVLSDCFHILTNPRLRIGKTKQLDVCDEEELNASTASLGPNAAQLNSVKGRLLSKISRKHMIETIVPILCNLKVILEKSRSPLLKDLMGYMVCIFRQFKNEINELLATNPTLLQEIQYDTRQFEKNEQLYAEAVNA